MYVWLSFIMFAKWRESFALKVTVSLFLFFFTINTNAIKKNKQNKFLFSCVQYHSLFCFLPQEDNVQGLWFTGSSNGEDTWEHMNASSKGR